MEVAVAVEAIGPSKYVEVTSSMENEEDEGNIADRIRALGSSVRRRFSAGDGMGKLADRTNIAGAKTC